MSQALRVLVAETTDPYFNLATEDWIFHDMDCHTKVLFLWRNEKSIIVGRGQNVWSECALDQVEADGVHVVRRHSGGGAVYQDLGNTCFTFMRAKEASRSTKELYAENNEILKATLSSLGIQAEASGRNDLVVNQAGENFKISGSAFKESKDRCFHHGTMLMNVDLGRLSSYLTPDSQKLKAKGIKSVRSRVLNLQDLRGDLDHHIFCQALTQQFFRTYQSECEVETLNTEALEQVESLNQYYQKLKSWDWVYGKTPSFQHCMKQRFVWGGVEIHIDTEKGHIKQAKVFTDSLDPGVLETTSEYLVGRAYTKTGLQSAARDHQDKDPDHADTLRELYEWMVEEL